MAKTPRPFISHAHADKDRFVLDFAKRLRNKGVDAWVDSWEMLPGDSLVDKIFNEGLKSCTAFIVVLSKNSVNSRWVREELNAGIVKRIEDNTKLIPIRLDGCEVPAALKDTLWINVPDITAYEREFEQVVNAVYGQYSKPPLGAAPAYVRPDVLQMDGLTPIDSVIFEHACKTAIEQGHSALISGARLVSELEPLGISEKQIMETEEILEGRLYIEVLRVMGPLHAYDFSISSYGFDQFVQAAIPDYGELCASVAGFWSKRTTIPTFLSSKP
jgi:TIR domain